MTKQFPSKCLHVHNHMVCSQHERMSVACSFNECNGNVRKMRAMEVAKEYNFCIRLWSTNWKLNSILMHAPSLEARALKTIDVISLKTRNEGFHLILFTDDADDGGKKKSSLVFASKQSPRTHRLFSVVQMKPDRYLCASGKMATNPNTAWH